MTMLEVHLGVSLARNAENGERMTVLLPDAGMGNINRIWYNRR